MKRNLLLLPFLLAVIWGTTVAQNQTRSRRVTTPEAAQTNGSNTLPSTIVSPEKPANHFAKRNPGNGSTGEQASMSRGSSPVATANKPSEPATDGWGNSPVASGPRSNERTATLKPLETSAVNNYAPRKLIDRTTMAVEAPTVRVNTPPLTGRVGSAGATAVPVRRNVLPTQEYRVGIGDVLDIRVLEMPTQESTLFTVLATGLVEYPLLSAPVNVVGLTTDEISSKLVSEIKVIENARFSVSVRDYASHSVVVTGWVDNPGRKMLRREAVPLYTVLAEALPRVEASVATIVRDQRIGQPLAMNDQKAMATLLLPGDVVKITGNDAAAKQFVYVGGQVVAPGEKGFRVGMTLTQAILAAGGMVREAGKSVKVSRRNTDGFLVAIEYDMRSIQDGRSPDPLVQAGDRIEVGSPL